MATDLNGVQTIYSYADALDRVTQIRRAAGLTSFETQTNVMYSNPTDVNVYNDQNTAGDKVLHSETRYDGLGRQIEARTYKCDSDYIATQQTYDALGRVSTTTSPSQPGDGLAYVTTYGYDALGRTTSVLAADGSVATNSYTGYYVTATDQAGKARVTYTDGLGRLAAVWENPSGPNYETTYQYDVLDDLTQVNQGSETRTFSYDSMKRLVSSVQPESGTTSYTYDTAGNVATKTDARGTQTTYSYDALNRVTQKLYSDGTPPATYQYDGLGFGYSWGHLISVSNANSTTTYVSIDPLGRVTASNQQTGGQTYGFTYYYNRAGSLYYETYPSGRGVTTSYDGANRVSGMTGTVPGGQSKTYIANLSYMPFGAPQGLQYGNVARSFGYNNRLQITSLQDTVQSTSASVFAESPSWNNNGTLQSVTVQAGGALPSFTTTFGYDTLNRLTSASDSGGWSRNFGYDQYGNMWVSGSSGVALAGNTPTAASQFNSANQINGLSYDAAGNLLLVNGNTASYDAENRLISLTQAPALGGGTETLAYDGLDQRVQKSGRGGTTVYVYDALGRLATESSTAGASALCTTCYPMYDHLGSVRGVADQNGNVVARHDYLPFGEEVPAGSAGRSAQWGVGEGVSQRFTGQVRDSENGMDFFNARYFTGALGRFNSADPGNAGTDMTDPQTWNGYAYVRNNPLALIDPSGLDDIAPNPPDGPCEDDPFFCGGGWPAPFPFPLPEPPPPPVTVEQPNPGAGSGPIPNSTTGVYAGGSIPPGSFPGGENLGLPPGLTIPGLPGFGLNLPCDFGDCGTGLGVLEDHHIFPQQLRQWFLQHGIEIDAFLISLEREIHRLKPNGIHTKLGGNWNAVWRKWIAEHPNATPSEIMNQARKMLSDFGIGAADTLPDIFIIVNPCITSPFLPFCPGAQPPGAPPTA